MKSVMKTAVWLFVLAIFLFVLLPNVGALNQSKQSFAVANASGCEADGDIVMLFPDEFIRSDDRTGKPNRGGHFLQISAFIPAGEYEIILHSYDNHSDEFHPEQTREQWHLIFRAGDEVVATSNSISDLPDNLDSLTEKVNDALSIPKDVDNVLAYHSFYLDPEHGRNINSVHPRCAGLIVPEPDVASIGDFVWHDANKNGLQDNFEEGVAGVPVHLYDQFGFWQASTSTDENGRYLFGDLTPGTYAVQVDPPAGWIITGRDLGDNAFDSDIDENGRMVFTELTAFENDLTWDAGIYQDTPPTIEDPHGNLITMVCPGGTNSFPTAQVDLFYDDIPLETRAPDFNGQIEFTTISSVNDEMGYLENWNFTESFDPDLFRVVVHLPTDTLTLGATDAIQEGRNRMWRIDLPFEACNTIVDAAIGDFVWLDWDQNDVQDNGEPGIKDVTVILFDANGEEVARTTTGNTGHYLFDELVPGDYSLQFIPPAGYVVVKPRVGISTALDSDINLANFRTPMTTLEPFEVDLTWDAGLYTPNKLPGCSRFNLDLGRNAQTGAGVNGRYVMIEITTGSALANWDAESWWVDSGWIREIPLAHFDGSWVDVYFHPEGDLAPVKLEVINPAPDTQHGWLAPGVCHAIELQFPADWNPISPQ